MQAPQIDIVMATYNGDAYLAEQIESIRYQSYTNWRLLVNDDGSTDETLTILRRYEALDDRIKLVSIRNAIGGAAGNFLALLSRTTAPYAMPCDQDDIWLADKVEREIGLMLSSEDKVGGRTPQLVFSDSAVVDENLEIINPSCASAKPYASETATLAQVLFNNVGQGCTMLLNRSLIDLVSENAFDPLFKMHDYWIMVLAFLFGDVVYCSDPTVLYRQHSNNLYGVKYRTQNARNGLLHVVEEPKILLNWFSNLSEAEKDFQKRANLLLGRFGQSVAPDTRRLLEALAHFDKLSLIQKERLIQKQSLIRNQRNLYARGCQHLGMLL